MHSTAKWLQDTEDGLKSDKIASKKGKVKLSKADKAKLQKEKEKKRLEEYCKSMS